MEREILPNEAYAQFASNFEASINSPIFLEPKVKVYPLQTSGGKSHYQDKKMPLKLKEVFPEIKYIFRLSPTREVAYDGTFVDVKELSVKDVCTFSYISDPPSTSILDAFKEIPNTVLCISCTHTYFITNFERLIPYASDSVLVVEEAHQFIGCADPGSESYVINFGYSSEYTAETWQRIEKWRDINPRILGFTATPTEHHKGHAKLSDQFIICGELVPKEILLTSQAWLNVPHPYSFTKYQGKSSVEPAIHQSIDLLFEREQKLIDLKYHSTSLYDDIRENLTKDPNINSKLTAFYVCGDARGVWGCPIDEVREIISKYLLADCGYEPHDRMIATMVEEGNTIWSLDGIAVEKVDNKTIIQKLHDEFDPLRFLLVINRGRSGINVHNLTAGVICRIRDPKEVKTPIPIQIFGRMVRLNPGTGDIVRKQYANNLDNYLKYYSDDYNVDINTVIETIKIANVFDLWHPTNGKAKRTWEESLVEFQKYYVNSAEDGFNYLYEFTGIQKPQLNNLDDDLIDEIPLNCPYCGSLIEEKINEWVNSGALNKFFVDPE